MGAASAVTTGYGIWVNDLQDPANTLVKANAAAIKISGFNEYSRILWTGCSAYCPSSGVLELQADTAVQTAPNVKFNVGGSGGNANCNAGGYQVAGAAPSGQYLRGNGTKAVFNTIQPNDLPDASASQRGAVNTTAQTLAGFKTFQDGFSPRRFNQATRPTLNTGELAWWRDSDASPSSLDGVLMNDGSNYFYIAGYEGGQGVVFQINP